MAARAVLGFPLAINEKAARTVAAVVAVTGLVALATGWLWLALPLAYGFWARVLTGPTLSPLGRLASSWFAPRHLGTPKWVAGPPKRFAQAMGAGFTTGASVAWLLGADTVAVVLLALLVVAATLEAAFALCLGCKVFAALMRVGLVPRSVCEQCAAPVAAP